MGQEISFCVFTTHAVNSEDYAPRRFISEAQLQHYKAMEIAALAFAAALSAIATGRGRPGRSAAPILCDRPRCRRLQSKEIQSG